MSTFFKLLATFLGFIFPVLFIQAVRSQQDDKKRMYTILSSLCFGLLVLILMLFMPNH